MQHNKGILVIGILLLSPLLSGCGGNKSAPAEVIFDKQPSPFHSVKTGESVASIAQEYNMDMQELVVVNSLKPPYRLVTGQRLIVSPSSTYRPTDAVESPYGSSESVEVVNAPPGTIETSPHSGIFVPPPPATDLSDDPQGQTVKLSQQGGYLSASGTYEQPGTQPAMPAGSTSLNDIPSPQPLQPGEAAPPPPQGELTSPQPEVLSNEPAEPAPSLPATGTYSWPVQGKVIRGYGAGKGQNKNDGINIQAPLGTPVQASNNGRVAHTGNQIGGFGNVVLIKHDNGYMSVYAHLDEVSVARGDVVKIGQKIGTVGKSGNAKQTQLHFEIRKGTTPLNPENLLK